MPFKDPEARKAYLREWKRAHRAHLHAKREENKEAINARKRAARAADPERYRAYEKISKEKHREKVLQRKRDWHAKNASVIAEKRKISRADPEVRKRNTARVNAWIKANPHHALHFTRLRQIAKLKATPAWADLEAIMLVYKTAAELSKTTGVKHHVDHIVPLRSQLVCGLHWEGNLQILTAAENIQKGNKHWPDMP